MVMRAPMASREEAREVEEVEEVKEFPRGWDEADSWVGDEDDFSLGRRTVDAPMRWKAIQ
jgi:hypothetical protein